MIDFLLDAWKAGWIFGLTFTIVYICIALCVAMLVFFVLDRITARYETDTGIVYSKLYGPDTSSVGVGPVIGGNGGMTVVMTGHSEEFKIMFQGNKITKSISVDEKLWCELKQGETINVRYVVGGISGDVGSAEVIEAKKR